MRLIHTSGSYTGTTWFPALFFEALPCAHCHRACLHVILLFIHLSASGAERQALLLYGQNQRHVASLCGRYEGFIRPLVDNESLCNPWEK